MFKRKAQIVIIILTATSVFQVVSPVLTGAAPKSVQAESVIREVETLIPTSVQMVDDAIQVLSQGWSEMSPAEQELFQKIFDPGQTGDIDEWYVRDVLDNYRRIRHRLDGRLILRYEEDSEMCNLMRLYYTDLFRVHICPYFANEASSGRKARVLIHEVTHIALLVVDRPYYDPNSYSSRYNALTPRGSWTAQIPLLGSIFREISHSDTLYHPDTYSWFAAELNHDSLASSVAESA
jgi:hypothetical protein